MTDMLPSASCPFCRIAAAYPPIPPLTFSQHKQEITGGAVFSTDTTQETHAHLVLSTTSVLAFLDIMPLTRGHVLVVTRDHYEKLGDMGVEVSREWLPVISRVVMKTIFGTDQESDWSWNVVQNNGIGAAQQVPHVHFHVIPRPPLDAAPTAAKMSFVMFGRGQRDELDDEEGETLAKALREELASEVWRVRERERVDLDVDSACVRYQRTKGKL
ncbi:HIT family protein [Aspergillus clavatus NRRL 1]|uniref:HIT domain protein n=1 Tax=Aspergillus clavatus (strain ATCC 1007 / CBS 513.65 / DSM 816 / NCTC 3887 / NRRL 1 / QM 1276 / 107) TaxID=344612 RepID=A1CID8_ASPCL|nr:HIT domain protein [Aspergillus clavatus NRRL 1]EAW10643.1 HIT domain protein [Aspergillus clavatus NRRL 1]